MQLSNLYLICFRLYLIPMSTHMTAWHFPSLFLSVLFCLKIMHFYLRTFHISSIIPQLSRSHVVVGKASLATYICVSIYLSILMHTHSHPQRSLKFHTLITLTIACVCVYMYVWPSGQNLAFGRKFCGLRVEI